MKPVKNKLCENVRRRAWREIWNLVDREVGVDNEVYREVERAVLREAGDAVRDEIDIEVWREVNRGLDNETNTST